MAGAAGLILTIRGETRFLPASQVESVLPTPRLSEVPGSPLRLALIAGRVVPVLTLGPPSGHLVVCHAAGEAIALAGVSVQESGFFAADGDGVRVGETRVTPFDVAAELVSAAGGSTPPRQEGARR